jgi:hypothetical protein
MSSVHTPEHLTIEVTQVARYRAFEETARGLASPARPLRRSCHRQTLTLTGRMRSCCLCLAVTCA